MILFLLILFPCSIFIYFAYTKEKKFFLTVMIGALCALLLCAIRLFFMYEHRLIPDNFFINFIYYFLRNSLLPIAILFGGYYLFTKDAVIEKFKGFFPLLSSFYAIYLPYYIISNTQVPYSPYSTFLMPVLYLAMIVEASICMIDLYNDKTSAEGGNFTFHLVLLIIYLVFPALVDSLHAISKLFIIALIVSVGYIAYPVLQLIKITKSE